jgi:hypothetical protein
VTAALAPRPPGAAARGAGPRRDIVFVHVPKTAGTSLRVALGRNPGKRVLLQDYGPGKETSDAIRALQGPPARYATLREAVAAPGGLLLIGHFPAERYWDLFNADSFVTFLRDPVARVVSEWNHKVTLTGLAEDLATYAGRPAHRNQMTRMLGPDWRRFGFVGLTERYEASLPQLSAHIGLRVPTERRNEGQYPQGMSRAQVDAGTAARIAEWNAEDAALHAAVKAVWDRHGRWVPEAPPCPPRLEAQEVRPGIWRVLCADPDASRTWIVSIRQGGVEVARRWADRHALRLREGLGIRTGIGQFQFVPANRGLQPPPEGPPLEFVAIDPAAEAAAAG